MSYSTRGGLSEMGHKRLSGLRNHRGKDGRVYWYTDTRIGGRLPEGRRIYVRHGAVGLQEAERRHCELLELEWRRENRLGPPEETSVGYTFNEASELWLKALESAGRDPKTIENYRLYLSWSGRFIGDKALNMIRLEDLEVMRIKIREAPCMVRGGSARPLAFRTRRNIEHIASSLFKFAMHPSRGWADQNPFQALVVEKAPKQRTRKGQAFRRLHPREDEKLLGACRESWHACAIAIGLYLGVREMPVVSLRIEDVNLFSGVICVPCEFNKGHNRGVRDDQWLPMPRRLAELLRNQYEFAVDFGSRWLFPSGVVKGRVSASGHIYPGKLREIVARTAARIGYSDGANFHALRAICNNRLRASGISMALADSARGARGILGHASEQSAAPYLDATVEYLRPIIDAYDRWLDEKSAAAGVVGIMR